MARKANPARKAELLQAIVDYLLANGLGDLSLRPLAAALEVSPRVLLYHFGSKEKLIVEGLAAARDREHAAIARRTQRATAPSPEDVLRPTWARLSSPDMDSFLRLLFEVYGLALQDPERYEGFLDRVVSDWVQINERWLVGEGVARGHARILGTLLLATWRGLLLDILATGDRRRVQQAYEEFIDQFGRCVVNARQREAVRKRGARRS